MSNGLAMHKRKAWFNWLPCLEWGSQYSKAAAGKDVLAAVIVTLMLIPQSLAYAMLAGLPPVTGLYASILPLVLYAIFGTSRTLAVGPVAVISLMTAAALEPHFSSGSADYMAAAMLLAILSGLVLLLMAVFRLGFLANFLSHPVISGFISASGILIALSQAKHILGVDAGGQTIAELLPSLWQGLEAVQWATVVLGVASLVFLFWVRKGLQPLLLKLGIAPVVASAMAKAGPVLAIVATVIAVSLLGLEQQGVKVVGAIPSGLPALSLPMMDLGVAWQLLPAAILISLVGFVESVSVAQTLAAKRRERIEPNQELVGLGSANIAAALAGGFPVTGGFSRSVVNFDAGAQTPMAGVLTAIGIALTALFFTPLFHNLPHAVLAATIIVAVLSLVDLASFKSTWKFSRQDFYAQFATFVGVLLLGVEVGIILGVSLSLILYLWRTSRPHFAVVGQLPGSEHFRNVQRYPEAICHPEVLSIRVDESLYFSNARYLEDIVLNLVHDKPQLKHLVIMCSGVNLIDVSALHSLRAVMHRLSSSGIQLHLSEVKGPVLDQLQHSRFLTELTGQVFLSQYAAIQQLQAREND